MVRRGVREYFRLRPRSKASLAEQIDEEITLHIEMRVRDLIARGMSEGEARAEAERRFGEMERARAALQRSAEHRERTMSISEWLEGWRQDFRYSARSLRREPLLALVVVLTLGLGIGANATMFGIVDRLLLRGPAHIEAPERVQRVHVTWPPLTGGGDPMTSARVGYVASSVLREGTDVFEDITVYNHRAMRLGRGESAEEATVGYAASNLFPLLGVRPALGRFFGSEEDRPDAAERVAVLEYAHWQAHYGGTADVLGRTLVVDDEEFTIIGVAPRGFTGPELQRTKAWLPFSAMRQPTADWQTTWNATWVNVLTRLRPDVTLAQAEAASTATLRAAAIGAGRPGADEWNVMLRPATYTVAGLEPPEIAVSRWLSGVSLIVLLVACANVVNLLIARALRRKRELAVRLALGVSRGRLARLLLSESMLLAIAGCVVAALLAAWGGQFLRGVLLPDVAWDAPLNTRVLVFSATVALLTGILVGLIPALQAARHDVTGMLKAAGRQEGLQRSRLRGVLTVAQAALAVVLLIGATHFVRSLWNVQALDLGVDAERVLAVWPNFHDLSDLPEAEREAAQARRGSFREQAIERLRARPDVIAASRAVSTPLQGTMMVPLRVPGLDSLPKLPGGGPFAIAVDDGYFETVGTRILRGRGIEAADVRQQDPVVVINEPMARALWPGEDPLDRCIHIGGPLDRAPCFRVIGVAQETRRWRLVEEPAMQYYVPLGLAGMSGGMLLVRPASRRAATFIPDLRGALHDMEPGLNYLNIDPLGATLDPQIRPWRLGTTMFLVFGGLALVIAAVGLYSVIAYSIAQRRAELGIRLALGARAGSIVAMIVRQGVGLVLLGIAVGVPLAILGGRNLESLLFETDATHAGSFAFVAAVLLGVALLATVIPATRAGRTDPVEALRPE